MVTMNIDINMDGTLFLHPLNHITIEPFSPVTIEPCNPLTL